MSSYLGAFFRGASSALGGLADSFGKAEPDEGSERTPGGSQADSAENAPVPTQKASEPPKTLFWDPFTVLEQLGYKDRPSNVTYGTLRAIVQKMPIISDIIQTRVNQVASFAYPQHNRFEIGFRIKMRDDDDKPSPADKKFIKSMEAYIMRTGITDNPRGRANFETYLRKVAWDTLVFDQDCTEIVPNRKGQPAEFYAVDASSIRLADTARMHLDEDVDDEVRYVQIYDNAVISQYTQEELCFGVRNATTDMRLYGYGISELERLMNAITSILWAWEYNSRFFSQGSSAKGIINIKGTMPEKQLNAFKRHWYSMISGVENAWKTPIVNSTDDVQWVGMQTSNRDMEFNAWMDFLIKVVCAGYSMDPSEINFKYGNAGQKTGLSEDSNRDKVTESRERGLRPLLRHFANNLNHHIIWPINESFEFEFVGLDSMTRQDVAELNTKRVKTYRTIDELRAEDDLDPLPDGQGAIILDPTFVQNIASKQQMSMQQQGGGGGFGGFGGGNAQDEPPDEAPPNKAKLRVVPDEDADDEDDEGDDDEAANKSLDVSPSFRLDLRL